MIDVRPVAHLVIHFVAPGLVAGFAFKQRWLWAWCLMLATMVVDVDHLLADPVYDPNRCGIGFHPLHSWLAISVYTTALLYPPVRIVATGLLVHMGADGLDCLWLKYL